MQLLTSTGNLSVMATSRKVLLLFGDSKKVTSLAPAGSDSDVFIIKETAKNLFFDGERDKILVQEYCEDFEEWIDVEEDFVAKDKQKLKIVRVALIPDCHTLEFFNLWSVRIVLPMLPL